MADAGEERFSVARVDQIANEVTIQIETLEDTAEYRWLKGLKSILLYDEVKAYNERIGLDITLYVSEWEFDIIREKITGLKLKDVQDFGGRTVTGYNVQNNSIGPEKLTDKAKQEILQQAVDLMPEYADPDAARPSSDISVIDNLTSTSATDALSANQGRVLNEKMTPDEKSSGITFETAYISNGSNLKLYKIGRICFVTGYITIKSDTQVPLDTTMFTLPDDCKPIIEWTIIAQRPTTSDANQARVLLFKTNGTCSLHNGSAITGGYLRIDGSFIAAN